MTSLYHRLSRDELIVLVETIEHDIELCNKKEREKNKLMLELCSPVVKHYECYSCKRWAMTCVSQCCFSEHQSWIPLNFDKLMVTHTSMMILKCLNCSRQVCKACCSEFNLQLVLCLSCAEKLNNPPKNTRLKLLRRFKSSAINEFVVSSIIER